MSELTPLSASRIKTLKECSWRYFCRYILRLPKDHNDGSRRGSITHDVLEGLARPDRKEAVETILKKKDPFVIPSVHRIVMIKCRQLGIEDEENVKMVSDFILKGLQLDFFGTKGMESSEECGLLEDHAEIKFDITVDKPEKGVKYRVLGFIDRLFLYVKNRAKIRDYKTSKKKFSGEDLENNLQHLIYDLATRDMYPEYTDRSCEFLFLKFNPTLDHTHIDSCTIKMDAISDEELGGLEHELTHYQHIVDNFDENDAYNNFAASKGFPDDGSFTGRLLCGFAKYPYQLKKDGSLMFHCPFKFAYDFYRIFNKEGEEVDCVKVEDFNVDMVPEDGYKEKYHYSGCPKFK